MRAGPAVQHPPALGPRAMSLPVLTGMTAGVLALQPLATDLYLPTLPTLVAHFAVPVSTVQLTLSLFVLCFGLWQLAAGPLSDRYGRYPVVLGGIAVYAAGSLACLLAGTLPALLAGRILQAVGACSAIVATRASVRDVLPPADSARLLARAGALMGLAPLTGPLAGGLLLSAWGWRASFAVLSAASLALALAALLFLRETHGERDPAALRPARLFAAYREVLRTPSWHAYAWTAAMSYAGLFAFISGSSFVLIRVLGLTPQAFGLAFSTVVAGYIAGTLLCPRCIGRFGLQGTLYRASALQVARGATMAGLAAAGLPHVLGLVLPQFIFLVGHGLSQPVTQAGAVAAFPRTAGTATALRGLVMMLVAAATGLWVGASYDGTLRPLTGTILGAGLAGALVAATLVRRHGALH